jgi:hypothetical protein
MATETVPAVPGRWELAAENIAVKKQESSKYPGFPGVFALLPPPFAPANPCRRV